MFHWFFVNLRQRMNKPHPGTQEITRHPLLENGNTARLMIAVWIWDRQSWVFFFISYISTPTKEYCIIHCVFLPDWSEFRAMNWVENFSKSYLKLFFYRYMLCIPVPLTHGMFHEEKEFNIKQTGLDTRPRTKKQTVSDNPHNSFLVGGRAYFIHDY